MHLMLLDPQNLPSRLLPKLDIEKFKIYTQGDIFDKINATQKYVNYAATNCATKSVPYVPHIPCPPN